MPIRLSDVASNTRQTTVWYDGEEAGIIYRPGFYTGAIEERVANADAQRQTAILEDVLSECLISWEVLDDKGNPVPTTKEALHEIPTLFLAEVFKAIGDDMKVGEAGKPSISGSRRGANGGRVRTSTR